jgi:hypothetical protein
MPSELRHAAEQEAWEDELERRRSAQSYYDAGLPWTGEFQDLVDEGLVDVS